jgi:hypothetical protein
MIEKGAHGCGADAPARAGDQNNLIDQRHGLILVRFVEEARPGIPCPPGVYVNRSVYRLDVNRSVYIVKAAVIFSFEEVRT